MSKDFSLENDADLCVAVLWACSTSESHRFSTGVVGDSVYNNYYATAYGAAFVAVTKWLFFEAGITHGYSKNFDHAETPVLLDVAEAILDKMSECGPEPVRQLRKMVDDDAIRELLRPDYS
jgi:hypothetical protein